MGRYKGGNIEYYVESIGKGRRTGITKTFATRPEAERFARSEIAKGRGISVGSLSDAREKALIQRNMQITALGKGRFGKTFARNYGKFTVGKTQRKRNISTKPFLNNSNRWW